jgi:hypothetical protein
MRELSTLSELRSTHDAVERGRQETQAAITSAIIAATALKSAIEREGHGIPQTFADAMRESADEAMQQLPIQRELCVTDSSQLDRPGASTLRAVSGRAVDALARMESAREHAISSLGVARAELEAQPARQALVADSELVSSLLQLAPEVRLLRSSSSRCASLVESLRLTCESFATESAAAIAESFEAISGDVTSLFECLEASAPGIRRPRLKLAGDQERAVLLEIEFHGTVTSTAHKYLSESQLNSFGIAVFLASAKCFNTEFPVLILDDVINSMDAEKRPLLLDALEEHFGSHQVILLTHDEVWRDRIYRRFPRWGRVELREWQLGTGLVLANGQSPLDSVRALLDQDRPTEAGRLLGPYIEGTLRDSCEYCEVEIKFRRRADNTLEELLSKLRQRCDAKLGATNGLTQALRALETESGFRNLCAHARDATTPLTPGEMRRVLAIWERVERMLYCPACCREVRWVDPVLRCACGTTTHRR